MLYIIGSIVAVLGAGWGLTGLFSLKARDKHAITHYSDDAYAQQTLFQMHNNPTQGM
ncbi:hypothetical protein [Brevibacillus formosus]|uniref:hypothetical protein n=1 Tax=Brevibacillus formosus TaxID=54913 RepID=UPI00142D97F8|nr:hypothetical protein [Brevibacillus formosus]